MNEMESPAYRIREAFQPVHAGNQTLMDWTTQ